MQTTQTITVKEFRKITGKDTQHFDDEQIEELIGNLDFIAKLFIDNTLKSEAESISGTVEEDPGSKIQLG